MVINGVDMLIILVILFAGIACFLIARLVIEIMYNEDKKDD